MKRKTRTSLVITFLMLVLTGGVLAQSTRTTPEIEGLFKQSVAAIDAGNYRPATQLLTRLIGLPEHVYSERAQELLGNVREANGQLAHAVAEYEIYLTKYPDGPGASRVSHRLNSILAGAAPVKTIPVAAKTVRKRQPSASTAAPPPRRRSVPIRKRYGRGSGPGDEQAIDPDATIVRNSGSVRLFYRYNEGSTRFTQLRPDGIPDITERDDDVYANALTTFLRISRVVENKDRKVTLSFSGAHTADFEDSSDNEFRLYELLFSIESKQSGRMLTFGRQRLKPRGVAYRLDGIALKLPTKSGVDIGLFAGSPVGSTREDFFDSDLFLVGVSATLPEGTVGPGELSAYIFEQRDGSVTDRRPIGLEYSLNLEKGHLFGNAEYDLKFGEINRALVSGTRVLANKGRLTARLAYYRSPRLSAQNALIGQSVRSLGQLDALVSKDTIEDLALSRTSKVTTFGLTYYGPLTEKWSLSAFGTIYDTSGKPATTGIPGVNDVAAVSSEGNRSYFGIRFIGSSLIWPKDQLTLGGRYAHSDDSDLFVAETSMRFPATDKWTIRPRLRAGYRDRTAGASEEFIIPSVFTQYRINRKTSLQFEVGGRWSKNKSPTQVTKQDQFFLNAGISRSF